MGYSTETPMESAWRDARIARIYGEQMKLTGWLQLEC